MLLTCWLLVCTVFQSVPLICLSKKTKWRPSNKEGIKWLIWYQKFLNNLSFALLLYSNKLESCFDVKEDNTQITWMLMTDSLKWYACGISAQIGDIPFKGNRLYTRCLVANAIISYRCWTVNIKNIPISIKRKTHKKTNCDNGVEVIGGRVGHFLNLLLHRRRNGIF